MIERTIVEFGVELVGEQRDKVFKVRLADSPRSAPEDKILENIDLDAFGQLSLDTPDAIVTYGERVAQALVRQEGIKKELNHLLERQDGKSCSLYFKFGPAQEAERIRWETLCGKNKTFYALKAQSPIARIAEVEGNPPYTALPFHPPLRVQAFISAFDVIGAQEWKHLYKSIQDARGPKLPIMCQVFVGEPTLHDQIKAEAANDALLQVGYMPPDIIAMRDTVGVFKPHLLHLFCHGSAGSGEVDSPFLDLAVKEDWEALELSKITGEPLAGVSESVILKIDELIEWYETKEVPPTWLVTLNCCQGGTPVEVNGNADGGSDALYSMAYRLVAKAKLPGVAAMQESVSPLDAHVFCQRFYPAVFKLLSQALQHPDEHGNAVIDWAPALVDPRKVLKAKRQGGRQWTLPVLYAPMNRLMVNPKVPPPTPEVAETFTKIRELADMLKRLPPTTPEGFRQELIDEFLHDVPVKRRPDIHGNLPFDS